MPNPVTTIAGLNGLTFQGNKFSFSPRTGFTLRMPYKGPSGAAAASVINLLLSRTPFTYDQQHSVSEITIEGNVPVESGGPPESPMDSWQLKGNELQKSVYEHPNTKKIVNSGLFFYQADPSATPKITQGQIPLNYQVLAAIKADMNLISNGQQQLINSLTPGSINTNDGNTIALLNALRELVQSSGDSYAVFQPVLRHTQIVTDSYSGGGFNFNNAETIYTTTQLLSECRNFPYPLPGIYANAILSIPVTSAPGYTWGWRKVPPDFNTVANYKNEIITEFSADLWNTGFSYALNS
jgi:hypothetical protein